MVHGVNINPIAFLVIQENNVKLLPVNHVSSIDKLLDYIPDIVEKANTIIEKGIQNKKEEKIRNEEKSNKSEKVKSEDEINIKPKRKRTRTVKEPEYDLEYDETIPNVEKSIEYVDEDEDD